MSTVMTVQDYLLIKVAEEAAEVSKNIMKALRFGLDDYNPHMTERVTNRELIRGEILDLLVAIDCLSGSGVFDLTVFPGDDEMKQREEKLMRYLEVSRGLGRVK